MQETQLIRKGVEQFTCIEFALFTLGVLFAYVIIGYKKHYEVRPGPYIVSCRLWEYLREVEVLKALVSAVRCRLRARGGSHQTQ